jgi:hypothetical protein
LHRRIESPPKNERLPLPGHGCRRRFAAWLPWIGFPVACAVSGALRTVFGDVAMVMSR